MKRAILTVIVLAGCEAAAPSNVAHVVGDGGVAADHFELRISEPVMGANGHTKREVFVFGRHADGTAITDRVIVSIDRASAGALLGASLELGPLGAHTYFTPCDGATAGCLGAATLTVARESAPSTILATRPIMLVTPSHVSTVAPCLPGRDAIYVDGHGVLYNAMNRISGASWFAQANLDNGQLKEIYLHGDPTDPVHGHGWSFQLGTYQLPTALAPGIYLDAQRPTNATPGHAGLDVSPPGRSCTAMGSSFEVHHLVTSGTTIMSVLVSFEHHCSSTDVVEGCFRFDL